MKKSPDMRRQQEDEAYYVGYQDLPGSGKLSIS